MRCFPRRKPVEDRGLDDSAKLDRQTIERTGQITVGDTEEHHFLRCHQRRHLRHPVRYRRPTRSTAQHTNQSADRNPPNPRSRLASSAPPAGAAPDCYERVLHSLGNHVAVRASVTQPCRYPRLMPHVQLAQSNPITISDCSNQLRIAQQRRVHAHALTVAQTRHNGSRSSADHLGCELVGFTGHFRIVGPAGTT